MQTRIMTMTFWGTRDGGPSIPEIPGHIYMGVSQYGTNLNPSGGPLSSHYKAHIFGKQL